MTSAENVISRLRGQTRLWRAAVEAANDERAHVNLLIIEAKQAGYSFAQIREATGLGTGTIQMVLAKAGLLSD
ncbi:hypothetical protein MINTMi27_15540 [Mycobacterium intracellulare]|uniref:hypothetical protein n=1 Tax=Mycobacterium intracellulare TaxID=1767 RepID=UPI0019288A7C|nr:hypothetical protein [Mycobacterium intracellulare]BCP41461.1 hypothetical protein MINTMi27_15540 [Mycobacterium intracellulare]